VPSGVIELIRSGKGQNTFETPHPPSPWPGLLGFSTTPTRAEGGACRKRGRKPVVDLRPSF
jgi:hypothetical protein